MRGAKLPKKGDIWIVKSHSVYVRVPGASPYADITTRYAIPVPYGSYLLFLEDMRDFPEQVEVLWKNQKCWITFSYVTQHMQDMERLK